MNDLLDINRKALFAKLDALKKINDKYWICNDIINALSEAKARDKRIINDYKKPEEIIVIKTKVAGVLRECRCFTLAGVKRYLHDGKLYNYKNACVYFGELAKDKQREEYLEQLAECETEDNLYDTKKILKWIFEKRKSTKELDDTVSISKLLKWLENYTDDINDKKLALLKEKCVR